MWRDSQDGCASSRLLGMPTVRFTWNAQLVDVRREVCPRARWDKAARAWTMTLSEAEAFVIASHTRLDLVKMHTEIAVDDVRWRVGFVSGAPERLSI